MLKKTLLAKRSSKASPYASQGLKNLNFVSKTAKALLIVILFAAVFFIGPLVLAQNGLSVPALEGSGLATASLGVMVARIINAALGLLGLVAVIIIIYAGVLWMTAMGQEDKVAKAKRVLVEAVIGLIIIVLSFAIAQFIFFALGINPWGGGGGGGGIVSPGGPTGGALGAGIIYSTYPARNAINIPRNTKIVITFKEGICVSNTNANSFINTNDPTNLDPKNLKDDDVTKSNMILIYPKPAAGTTTKNNIAPEKIKVSHIPPTANNRLDTFTFRPVDYLGNEQTPTQYVVELTNNLKKTDCTTPAFGSFGGYNWSFTVSTVLDLTPPKIESVIPRAIPSPFRTVARNTVIQINFNEAIDPTTLAGKLVIDGGGKTGPSLAPNSYDLMTVKAGDNFVAGEFYFSNQYRTVEFITNDPCGVNSCGDQVYCLPSLSDISVLVKAAALAAPPKPTAVFPYTGLVDMADNSLDGNKDGLTQGPAAAYDMNSAPVPAANNGDNATWIFKTNKLIDLIPPQIEFRNPGNSDSNVDPDSDLNLGFDKIISPSSLTPADGTDVLILEQPGVPDAQKSGYDFSVKNNTDDTKSAITINTYKGLKDNQIYNIIAKSGIKDDTQNCYLPCSDIGNCTRVETATPGQYIKSTTTWIGNYPSCNLAP